MYTLLLIKKITNSLTLFFFIFILYGTQQNLYSQGDLLIFPKRLEFNDLRNRIKIINLHNKGKDSATYQISYVEYEMKENGAFKIVESPNGNHGFASPYLRFYPRNISLAPNETQVVKVQLVKTANLEHGEYRSHLYFRAVPKFKEADNSEGNYLNEMKVKLVPVFGISIANIIRLGKSDVQVSISDLVIEQLGDKTLLNLTFNRTGDFSCYGDIKVIYRSRSGQKVEVGEIQGFAVYTPGQRRKAKIELKKVESIDFKQGGELIVKYHSQNPAKTILSEAKLKL